jgi:RES domain-containing protein
MLHGARWNCPGRRVIYAAESYAGALLEILVHASDSVPRSQGYVEIQLPGGLSIEEASPDDVPQWDSPSFAIARAFGDRWYDERRTPVLIVPSLVTLVERNILIDQDHPDFDRIKASQPMPVRWDARLLEAVGWRKDSFNPRKPRPPCFPWASTSIAPGSANLPLTPTGIWNFYDGRARLEPRVRELREDFALRKIPTATFAANALTGDRPPRLQSGPCVSAKLFG